MPLDINYEKSAMAIRGRIRIGLHWGRHGSTYGLQSSQKIDFRNDYKIRSQITLDALGGRGGEFALLDCQTHKSVQLIVPPVFPQDLVHTFSYSKDLYAKISTGELAFFVEFT